MLETNHCYCMDCMEGMAQFQDGCFDLAVVDPPYYSGPPPLLRLQRKPNQSAAQLLPCISSMESAGKGIL